MKRKSRVEKHFDKISKVYDSYKTRQRYYYDNLKSLLSSFIPSGSSVLEVGCGTGDLIAALKPKSGFGFDISSGMVEIAKKKHKNIRFSTSWPRRKFKYIFMSDVVEHLEDPKKTFSEIYELMDKNSIFICTMANPLLEPVLMAAEKLKLKMPEGDHKRISYNEINGMLKKVGLKTVKHDFKLLIPVYVPIVTFLANKYLEKFFKKFAFIEYFVAIKV